MSPDETKTEVAIARIEEALKGIRTQIDFSERSSAQLVRLVDDRFSARFDTLERRLDEMDRARDHTRHELMARLDDHGNRLDALEDWRTGLTGRFIGAGVVVGFISSAAGAALLKLFNV